MFNDCKVIDFIKSQETSVLRHFKYLKSLIDLRWVSFERIYNDGYTFAVCSDAEVYKSHFEINEVFVHAPAQENIRHNIYKNISFQDVCANSRISSEMRFFDCKSHLLLISYHKEYQDVFRFVTRDFGKMIYNLQLIEHSACKFIAKSRQLIESDNEYFMLPAQMQVELKNKYFSPYIVVQDNLAKSTQLTAREFCVLRLYVKGYPHKQIGEILGVEANTSEKYLENIKVKLQISSRKELKALACDNWLI